MTTDRSERLLRSDRDDDLLSTDGWEENVSRVIADRRLLSGLTSRQRLEREELDELFANADEMLATLEEKLLRE